MMVSYFESLKGIQLMSLQIRLTGILLVGFSVLEFVAGATAYGFLTENNVGGWWGAVPTVLLGIASQYCNCRPSIWCILIFSCIAEAICLGAMVDDASHVLTILQSACYSTNNTQETYGKLSKLPEVYNCSVVASADCICATNQNSCYAYHLTEGSNCGSLFTIYHGELLASSVCNAVLSLLCGIQFFFCLFNVGHTDAAVGPYQFPFEYLKGAQHFSLHLRLTGLLLIGFSIVELAVGWAVYEFLSENHAGAWWSAIGTLVLGCVSQYCKSRAHIDCIMVLSFCVGIVCIVAVAFDGHYAERIHTTGCYSTSHVDKTYGKEYNIPDAYNCPLVASADCICYATQNCYAYHLTKGSDCDTLFSVYYNELLVSCSCNATLSFLCILQFFFSLANTMSQGAMNPLIPAPSPSHEIIPDQNTVVFPASDTVLFNGVRTSYMSVVASLGPRNDSTYPSAPLAPWLQPYAHHSVYPSHDMDVSTAYAPQSRQEHHQDYGYADIYADQVELGVPVAAYLLIPLDPNQVETATEVAVAVAEPCE